MADEIGSDINQAIDEVVVNFGEQMLISGGEAWQKARPLINSLDTEERDKIIAGQTQIMPDVSLAILGAIQSSRVQRAKERMKNQLEPIRRMIRNHYEEKFGFPASYEVVRMATGLTESTKNYIDTELDEEGFKSAVLYPAEAALTDHIQNGSTINATLSDMEQRIADRMETFSQVKTATIMQQFGREINDLYGQIGQQTARYVGPKDDRNRDFCAERVGNKYTIEEIRRWPVDSPGTWEGMLPDTTANNIFINLGGFNCRHILEWD